MHPLNPTARLSRRLGGATSFLICALSVTLILAAVPGRLPAGMVRKAFCAAFPDVSPAPLVTPVKTALCPGTGRVALLPMIRALIEMKRRFARDSRGDILSQACACHILRIGQALVAAALPGVVTRALQGLALTYDNGPGHRMLALSLDGATAGFILAGGLLVVIGWVMGEAARVADDNRGFV